MCDNETVDIPIQNVKILNEEDNFDKNYSRAIPALFAFNFLKNVEQKNYVSEKEKNSWMMIEQKAIKWLKKQMDRVNIEQIIIDTQKVI